MQCIGDIHTARNQLRNRESFFFVGVLSRTTFRRALNGGHSLPDDALEGIFGCLSRTTFMRALKGVLSFSDDALEGSSTSEHLKMAFPFAARRFSNRNFRI
jgi:hypothetical protein